MIKTKIIRCARDEKKSPTTTCASRGLKYNNTKKKEKQKKIIVISKSFSDKTRVGMTCDTTKLDCLANNNNVTTTKLNGHAKVNGKLEVPAAEEDFETKKSLIILSGIFITSLVAMFYIYTNFPELDE